MKKYRAPVVFLLCLMAVTALLPVTVLAAGSIPMNRDASLTITEAYAETGISGVNFDIFLVSTVEETGELTPVAAFSEYADGLDIRGKNDSAWQAMAETLERAILLGSLGEILPTDSAAADETGTARFPSSGKRLTLGLYLVTGTRREQDGYVYATAPFFVLLPEPELQSNTWRFDVEANAKPEQSPVLADFSVVKIWKDSCHKDRRPRTITIQLMQDGTAYGDPVMLPHNGAWKYTWKDLDVNHKWTVTEKKQNGYLAPDIQQIGNTFFVTNTCDRPPEPVKPGSPALPQTGQLWWPVPVLIALGLLFVLIGLIRRRGARDA